MIFFLPFGFEFVLFFRSFWIAFAFVYERSVSVAPVAVGAAVGCCSELSGSSTPAAGLGLPVRTGLHRPFDCSDFQDTSKNIPVLSRKVPRFWRYFQIRGIIYTSSIITKH